MENVRGLHRPKQSLSKGYVPTPMVDLLVDLTVGHKLLSFMDVYFRYNQIKMYDPNMKVTSFIIDQGTYCKKVIPFGPKNTGATYQRFINRIFKEKLETRWKSMQTTCLPRVRKIGTT